MAIPCYFLRFFQVLSFVACEAQMHVKKQGDKNCWTSLKLSLKVLWVARENSRHITTPPLVPPRNDVWKTSAEIPYWWRVTTQIWIVHPISWSKFSRGTTNQKYFTALGSDASSVWNFRARVSDVISWGNQWRRREMSAVFSGYVSGYLGCKRTETLSQGRERWLHSGKSFLSFGILLACEYSHLISLPVAGHVSQTVPAPGSDERRLHSHAWILYTWGKQTASKLSVIKRMESGLLCGLGLVMPYGQR